MNKFPFIAIWFGVVASGSPAAAYSQIYKCSSKAGTTTYQQDPCKVGLAEQPIAVAKPAKEKRDEKELSGYGQVIALVLIQKKFCDSAYPAFKEKYAALWDTYRARHNADVRETENSAGYKYWQGFFDGRPLPKNELEARAVEQQCDGEVLDTMLPLTLPPNPKLASPQSTWSAFLTAWKKGDREEMQTYLLGETRTKFRQQAAINSPSYLRDQAAKVTALEFVRDNGEQQEFVIKGEGITNWTVVFVILGENWFISRW
jgi:hypothetical protein